MSGLPRANSVTAKYVRRTAKERALCCVNSPQQPGRGITQPRARCFAELSTAICEPVRYGVESRPIAVPAPSLSLSLCLQNMAARELAKREPHLPDH